MNKVTLKLVDMIIEDEKLVDDINHFYRDYTGVDMSTPQIVKHLSFMDNRTLVEILDNTYTDTCVRGDILNYHSQLLIGKEWPVNGDDDEVKKLFTKELNEVYEEKGYKVL